MHLNNRWATVQSGRKPILGAHTAHHYIYGKEEVEFDFVLVFQWQICDTGWRTSNDCRCGMTTIYINMIKAVTSYWTVGFTQICPITMVTFPNPYLRVQGETSAQQICPTLRPLYRLYPARISGWGIQSEAPPGNRNCNTTTARTTPSSAGLYRSNPVW